jgi:hypothetical protein
VKLGDGAYHPAALLAVVGEISSAEKMPVEPHRARRGLQTQLRRKLGGTWTTIASCQN